MFANNAWLMSEFLESVKNEWMSPKLLAKYKTKPLLRPTRGSNQICTDTFDLSTKPFTVCIPNFMLAPNGHTKHIPGKECVVQTCALGQDGNCPYIGAPYPLRVNDDSMQYKYCCEH